MTIEELQQQVAALSAQVAAITAPPTDYYTSQYSGEEIDQGVARALPGGEIDQLRPNRNLLDNWDFRNPVNQRAVTAGTADWGTYFLDRWLGQCAYTVNTESLSLTAGSYIVQKRESDSIFPCTLSVLLANGTILTSAFTEIGGKSVSGYGVFDIEDTFIAINNTNSVEIKAVKLEAGTVSTLANDQPADHEAEKAKCKRYFNLWASEAARTAALLEVGAMRTTPVLSTIDIGGVTYYTASADL